MNEQRLQAYLTLTQQLFNGTTEEEFSRTLGENAELIDGGFIEFLNQYAETAGQLTNLACQQLGYQMDNLAPAAA
jgi:hypothetical protein